MYQPTLDTEENTVLVAFMPSPKDMALAHTRGWYRLPAEHAPHVLTSGKLSHIAFYQPQSFGEERSLVRWYSPVTSLVLRRRIEVLPEEPHHPNAQRQYYIIGCANMQELPVPIRCHRPRRVVFIPTTYRKLVTATDINHLFNDSPLENLLSYELYRASIPTERQLDVKVGTRWFRLDFAVFCKTGNIGLECDGDEHHMHPDAVDHDKQRANLLATIGWRILHFTRSKLYGEMPATLGMVRDVINHYGGLQDPNADGGFRYAHGPDDGQPRLFG